MRAGWPERAGNCHKGPAFARIQATVGAISPLFEVALARRGSLPLRENMTAPRHESPPRPARKPSRSERLATELKANLRRRKAQLRARKIAEKPASGEK
jgi:hypothetical protein